ncbi:MAG: GCN5-related N-acetyltransferase [Anaerolineaceae bacterium]|nr:MAG: GCN5-related N-acetyltransferase [Anaerolineaceae bacterium]
MLPEQIKNFREVVTLKDGTYVSLRPLMAEDHARMAEMYAAITKEELRYFRHDVQDPETIRAWCERPDYDKVLPILALVKERAIGSASLHFFDGPKRHLAEIRIFLSKDFRKRGLGTKMLRAMVELARRQGAHIIVAEVIADMTKVVKAFEQVGFVPRCTLEDYFMFPDGDTTDVVFMTMSLKPKGDEF